MNYLIKLTLIIIILEHSIMICEEIMYHRACDMSANCCDYLSFFPMSNNNVTFLRLSSNCIIQSQMLRL